MPPKFNNNKRHPNKGPKFNSSRPQGYEKTCKAITLRPDPSIREEDYHYTNRNTYQDNVSQAPKVRASKMKRPSNAKLSKDEVLETIASRLDMSTTSIFEARQHNPTPSITIDERGFVRFAVAVFGCLQSLDSRSDIMCSEIEFVYYSLVILRAQQFSRYGFSNIQDVAYSEVQKFCDMMSGSVYPKVFEEYFKCLGTVTTKGGHPINMTTKIEKSHPVMRYTKSTSQKETTTHAQQSAEALADIGRLDEVICNTQSTTTYYSFLKSHFQNPTFTTLSPGSSSRRSHVHYCMLDNHMSKPFDFINTRVLENVSFYLNFLRGNLELSTFESRLIISPVTAEYDKVAQIRVRGPYNTAAPVYLTMREIQSSPSTILAAMFQLYTDDTHGSCPSDFADTEAFGLTIDANIKVLMNKLCLSYLANG